MPLTANLTDSTVDRAASSPRRKTGVLAGLLVMLSRLLLARGAKRAADHVAATRTEGSYRQWRRQELRQQLTEHFDVSRLGGCRILDFGCGTGELSRLLCELGGHRVTGVDMSAEAVEKATRGTVDRGPEKISPSFLQATEHDRIPLPDDSQDLICVFDVLEHIPDIATICREWCRVLRGAGRVWIWWSPWRGPFGHHLSSLIPIPWVHLLVPQKQIFAACAAMYDDPSFTPRKWDIDPDTGGKKTNKWHGVVSFEPFLNRLTKRTFERTVTQSGLQLHRCEAYGFRGAIAGRVSAVLRRIPFLGDGFVSYYVYELGRAGTARLGH